MVIQHNMAAINTDRQLGIVCNQTQKSIEKLSSGYKINRSGDDTAGLSISEKMRKQIRGLSMGVMNTEDGVSLCQVADGALNEVHDMLQRINELAIQSANGTYSDDDRAYIQQEVKAIVTEIDRIGKTTKFNEIFVFQGTGTKIIDKVIDTNKGNGNSSGVNTTQIPNFTFDQISMDCELLEGPFRNSSNGSRLCLQAKGTDGTNTKTWGLIYGAGGTSETCIRGEYNDGGVTRSFQKSLNNMAISNYMESESAGIKSWSRDFSCTDENGLNLTIRQQIDLSPKTTENQYYTISYQVLNQSGFEVEYDFMQHEDTAYANNDSVEHYFIDGGTAIDKTSMYSNNVEYTSYANTDINAGVPDNFSIVNVNNALDFTEKIIVNAGGVSADTVTFGHYSQIRGWDSYTESALAGELGKDTIYSSGNTLDMGFSLIWSDRTLADGVTETLTFQQGIVALDRDGNIPAGTTKADTIPINKDDDNKNYQEVPYGYLGLWIQSGADAKDGLQLGIAVMSANSLHIDNVNVDTVSGALKAIDEVDIALKMISTERSTIGAYQNRMEHTVNNEDNIVENTTAAESQIRDTDYSKEMVRFTNNSVLQQAGQAMLVNTDQMNEGFLRLLQ